MMRWAGVLILVVLAGCAAPAPEPAAALRGDAAAVAEPVAGEPEAMVMEADAATVCGPGGDDGIGGTGCPVE